MKKNLLYLLMAVFALNFISCKDDDNSPIIPAEDLNMTFGTDENTVLNLNYSNSPISGKQVKFNTKDNKTATLTLLDVIPGQSETIINNIQLVEGENEYTFNGNSAMTKATAGSIAYSGSIKKGELNLKLNVTMPDPKGWAGTYSLEKYTENAASGAIYFSWAGPDESLTTMYGQMFRTLGSMLLPQLLHSITLEADGNIRAEYYTGPIQADQEQMMGILMKLFMFNTAPDVETMAAFQPTGEYQKSSSNLAYWFEKEGQLYVKLNISAIIAQAMSDNSSTEDNETLINLINGVLNGTPAQIKQLLGTALDIDLSTISDATFAMLLDWVKNGIPMNVNNAEGHTYIFLNKTAFNPLMVEAVENPDAPGFNSDMIQLFMILTQAGIIPQDAQAAVLLLINLPGNWEATTTFNLGLDLKK